MLKCKEKLTVNVIIRDGGVSAYCTVPKDVANYISNQTGHSYRVLTATEQYIYEISKQGSSVKEAIQNLLNFFKANSVSGVARIGEVINQTSSHMNEIVEYKTSGILGDSYSVPITRNSSMNDRCRTLCD